MELPKDLDDVKPHAWDRIHREIIRPGLWLAQVVVHSMVKITRVCGILSWAGIRMRCCHESSKLCCFLPHVFGADTVGELLVQLRSFTVPPQEGLREWLGFKPPTIGVVSEA